MLSYDVLKFKGLYLDDAYSYMHHPDILFFQLPISYTVKAILVADKPLDGFYREWEGMSLPLRPPTGASWALPFDREAKDSSQRWRLRITLELAEDWMVPGYLYGPRKLEATPWCHFRLWQM